MPVCRFQPVLTPAAAAMFTPLKIGSLEVPNRFFMAPLTRCRATVDTHVPRDIVTEHYAARASAGLIIAEATMIQDKQSAFYAEPGIYSDEQVAQWRKVTDAVHANGGRIFLQIWHGGRAVVPENNGGAETVSASALAIEAHGVPEDFNATGKKIDYSKPRALALEEIPGVVALFAKAAENALAAGFDGVEIHGANGYLLDQFWRASANQRTDQYGGSVENRQRLMLEVVDAVCKAIGSDKVGLRLSPLNSFNGMKDEDPVGITETLAAELNKRDLAFLHVMRADFFQAQTGDVLTAARKHFKGPIVANMGYSPEEAEEQVKSGLVDAVAFGTKFISNPDLPQRVKAGAALADFDAKTFYTRGVEGYNTYPAM